MDVACFDVAVLGAGVQGSATAYYLARKSGIKKVLLLEQFSALHIRGSSHGSTRITRRAYDGPIYVKMMDEAFRMWSNLERESGTKLYEKTGILAFGPDDNHSLKNVGYSLATNSIPYQKLSASEVNKKYSNQLSLPEGSVGLFEEDGGILMAMKAVAAYQRMFVSAGGVFIDENPVTEVVPGQVIVIRTAKGTFRTRKLVITAGPWAPALLRTLGVDLPLQPVRTEIMYWKADVPEDYCKEKFPVFIAYTNKHHEFGFYGIPVHEYPGLVKICPHQGVKVTPDRRDVACTTAGVQQVTDLIEEVFKGVASAPSVVEPCIYTVTPDYNPVLDRHPVHSNIVFGAGFSGHGFKLSPVIGKILTELVLEQPPSYDLSHFRMNRFQKNRGKL